MVNLSSQKSTMTKQYKFCGSCGLQMLLDGRSLRMRKKSLQEKRLSVLLLKVLATVIEVRCVRRLCPRATEKLFRERQR
jgi:hypothetical protein